jgi:hypothetical protein
MGGSILSPSAEGEESGFFAAWAAQNDKLNDPVNISLPGHLDRFRFLAAVGGLLQLARAELL